MQELLKMSKKRNLPGWMEVCKSRKLIEKQEEIDNQHDRKVQKRTEDILKDKSTKSEKAMEDAKRKFKEDRKIAASQAFDQILSEATQLMELSCKTIYTLNRNECNLLCEDIELCLCDQTNAFIGFDMEWSVKYQVGKEEKTALIQICIAPDTCFLFHVFNMGFPLPRNLKNLLSSKHVKKVGVNIESDLWKLERDYDIQVLDIIKNSMVDLGEFANQVLGCEEKWSLDGLVKHLFHQKLDKNPDIRTGNWTNYPLSEEQKNYAALDALASYKVYQKLLSVKNSKSGSS